MSFEIEVGLELTYVCPECKERWTEYEEYVNESECPECGKEHIGPRAIKELY